MFSSIFTLTADTNAVLEIQEHNVIDYLFLRESLRIWIKALSESLNSLDQTWISPLIACRVVESIVKLDRISDNTLLVLVGKCFRYSKPKLTRSIYQEFHDALVRGKKI